MWMYDTRVNQGFILPFIFILFVCVCVCGWVGVSVIVSVCVQEGASKCEWVCKSVCVSVFGRVRVCMYSMYVLWVFVCVSVRTCVCACVCECSQQLFILGFYHYKQACVCIMQMFIFLFIFMTLVSPPPNCIICYDIKLTFTLYTNHPICVSVPKKKKTRPIIQCCLPVFFVTFHCQTRQCGLTLCSSSDPGWVSKQTFFIFECKINRITGHRTFRLFFVRVVVPCVKHVSMTYIQTAVLVCTLVLQS